LALVDGERLAERLLQVAVEGGISATERNKRLHALQLVETRLRYDEEASICAAITTVTARPIRIVRSSMNLMLRHEPAGGTRAAFSASLRTEGFVVRG
jgi:acid phosphatase class B